jgi:hypothetical protein
MDRGLISEKQRGLSAKSAKLDRRLISKKHRGFFAKWREISAGIYFSTDKAVDRVHAFVDRPGALGPPWTDGSADRGGAARRRAHRSSASGHSGAPKLTSGGATERGAHGELGYGLTRARAASRRTGDVGEGSAVTVLVERAA